MTFRAGNRITGLSWWGAAPIGVVLWGTAATLIYRRAQRKPDELAEGTAS